jgi:N-acetylglucosamine-6-sulfatase
VPFRGSAIQQHPTSHPGDGQLAAGKVVVLRQLIGDILLTKPVLDVPLHRREHTGVLKVPARDEHHPRGPARLLDEGLAAGITASYVSIVNATSCAPGIRHVAPDRMADMAVDLPGNWRASLRCPVRLPTRSMRRAWGSGASAARAEEEARPVFQLVIARRVASIVAAATLFAVAATSFGGLRQDAEAVTSPQNVVVIMTDDQNVDSLPVMRKLMRFPDGSWVHFVNAVANDSICCPARATVLTGQYSHHTGVINNGLGDRLDDSNTLPVWLDGAGYRTGLVGKYLNGYPWSKGAGYVPPGWDYFKTSSIGNADGHTKLAVDFINSSATPFFLYLAYRDPHQPAKPVSRYASADVYIPPDPPNLNEADVSDKPRWVRALKPLTQTQLNDLRAERLASQRALLAVDDGVESVVNALRAKGQLNNTMIVFLGDHGFSWGSHRHINKHCVYDECSRFPLLIRYPGLVGNRQETRLVSNVDLAATIAEYAGVTPSLPQDGRSIIPVLSNTASVWTEEVLMENHVGTNRRFFAIRVPGWTYAEYVNGDKELYDLTADPYQLQNRAGQAAYRAKQDELASRLHALM